MSAVINPAIPTLGRRIHVKKLSEDGEETDESYWLWLEFPETIKGLRSKCMEAFEPPRDHMIRFIHDDQLLCGNSLEALPNKCELWVQFVPKDAPLTPVSVRKSRKKRPVLMEDENVDPCPSVNLDAGSPIRKRQRLYPRTDISNLDLLVSTPPSPCPSEPFKQARTDSLAVTAISSRPTSPCHLLKPVALEIPGVRSRRQRSNASASFFEPNGPPTLDWVTRPDSPADYSGVTEDSEGVPVIAWEMDNRDESYYGYGILSFDKPRHEWVPVVAFDLLPRYSSGVPEGIDFNLLVCDVPYDVTIGEIRSALAENLALDPERLPQGDFDLVRKGQRLQDWMTCVPAYLGDGDAVFMEFGGDSIVRDDSDDEDLWTDRESTLIGEDLEEIKVVRLPGDSDED
ncbi:hypothetical protein RSOLAG1IB_01024 [Rhizoctonia solani AG-1 IB]|uniref:Uncharacterized protein n=1 Tax=Thanatephorus cucumeris (strain AG1-IB / isolate 7/3/14) TaxID=1108050 RepID=A0A0B7F8E4_THACB|nr:hypothetical protein RSOLAG1IB_01024 [Rhizoctonia solani AG-1 IB]